MFFFTYTAAVLTLLFVGAAVFLFSKGRKDALTYIFILYILADAIWIGGNAVADVSNNDRMLIISSGIAFVGSSCIVTFFLIFVDTFVDGRLPSFTKLTIYTLPSILFAIFSFSEYAVLDTMYPKDAPAQIVPGIQYYFFLLFLILGLIYVLTRLILFYRRSHGKRRLQTSYITLGFLALFIGGVTFGLILPLFGEFRFYNLAPQFSFIFAITSGYAIFKHNLLDIRTVVQRGFIYSILLFGIVGIYLLTLNIFGIFLQQVTQTAGIISAIITTIVGIFSVGHIDLYLRKKTDKFFFKDRYNYAEVLYSLSEKINKIVLVEDIKSVAEVSLQEILKTKTVVISAIHKEDAGQADSVTTQNEERITLSIAVTLDNTLIGTIFLDEKLSGEPYTQDDIVLLKTFSNQIAVAFEKAKLYKEVQDYSLELENKVAQRTAQIVKLQEEQTQMMLDISHKLQSPLTIVKNELLLIRKRMPTNTDFSFLEKTIDNISAFIYDLLHIARLDNAPNLIPMEKTNISKHILELIEYFELVATHNHIQLTHSIEPNIYLLCNKEQITELITNLVSNAVKYIGDHTHSVQKYITVSLATCGDGCSFTVEDNGIGIDENNFPYIFERFYRTSSSQQQSTSGTGLGLAICKKIVEIHNGSITVTSKLGVGTIFTVIFKN